MALQHLSDRVWLHSHDPDPSHVQGCVAVIAYDDRSVVVDADNSPYAAREMHLRSPADVADVAMLRSLVDDRFEWYVRSHDVPRPGEAVVAMLQ